MKNKIMIVLVSVLFTSGVFAAGQNEKDYFGNNVGSGMGYVQNQDQEILELSGTLELVNGYPPYLNVNNSKYTLQVPYHLLYNLDIKNGESISVKGYEMASHMWQWDDSNKSLYVTKATIKDEEYDLTNSYGGNMMGGRRGFKGRRSGGCW